MRILIIGGTRFIGPPTVRLLHEMGHTLSVFHRHPAGHAANLPPDVLHVYGNRRRLAEYTDELRDLAPEVVIDMIPLTEADAQAVMDVFAGVAGRVVVISSQDVYRAYGRVNGTEPGDPDPIPISEDGPLRQRLYPYRGETPRISTDPRKILDDYDKILVERVALARPDLPATVLRLPMVYGPGDYQHRLYDYLKRMIDRRPAILLSEQMAHWRWTRDYVINTAHAIALAATDEHAAGRIYNLGDMPALSTLEWIRLMGEAMNWRGEVVTAPDYQLPEDMKSQAGLDQHLVFDCSRIRAELGYTPPVGLGEAMRRAVAWERAHPPDVIDPAQFDYAAEDAILARL